MSDRVVRPVIVAQPQSCVDLLVDALGVTATRIDPNVIATSTEEAIPLPEHPSDLVWLHLVPASVKSSVLSETDILLRSAQTALRFASRDAVHLVFVALLPSAGAFEGEVGSRVETAAAAFEGFMRSEIVSWSHAGHRLLALRCPNLGEISLPGQRPREEILQRIPAGRTATVADVANAVRFFCSRRAEYISGTVVHVDGGWRAYSWIYPTRTI